MAKSINYLQKKKQDYELKMQTITKDLLTLRSELNDLASECEDCEYGSYK